MSSNEVSWCLCVYFKGSVASTAEKSSVRTCCASKKMSQTNASSCVYFGCAGPFESSIISFTHTHSHISAHSNTQGHLNNFRVVHPTLNFSINAPDAQRACVVGDWDNWLVRACPLFFIFIIIDRRRMHREPWATGTTGWCVFLYELVLI